MINKHCLYIFSRKSLRRLIPIHPFLWSKSFPEWFAFNRKYVYLLNCGFRKAKSWICTGWFVLNMNRMVLSKSNEWQAAHSFSGFSWSNPATETSHFLLTLNFTKCSYCVHVHNKYILFSNILHIESGAYMEGLYSFHSDAACCISAWPPRFRVLEHILYFWVRIALLHCYSKTWSWKYSGSYILG